MTTAATKCPECGGSEFGHRFHCKHAAFLAKRDADGRNRAAEAEVSRSRGGGGTKEILESLLRMMPLNHRDACCAECVATPMDAVSVDGNGYRYAIDDRNVVEGFRCAKHRAMAIIATDLVEADAVDALRGAEDVIVEAIGWVPTKNLDPDHHHYDSRAVGFIERCTKALRLVRKAAPPTPCCIEIRSDSKDDTIAKLTADNAALRDFAASPPIWWSVAADGAIIHAELEGCSAIAKFADNSCRLVRSDGEVLADLIVRARNETEKPQAAIEEIGAALLWSHRRSLRLAALATPNPGAGWVSPEEHARVVTALAESRKECEFWMSEVDVVERILVAAGITAGIEPKVTNKAREVVDQRDAARARLAEVEAERDRISEAAADDLTTVQKQIDAARKMAAAQGVACARAKTKAGKAEQELARVKAEAEGLRAALKEALDDVNREDESSAKYGHGVDTTNVRQTLIAALASPTPARVPR